MLKFWQLLMLYFRLGIVEGDGGEGAGEEGEGTEGDGSEEEDETLPGGDLDSLLDAAETVVKDGEGGEKPRENAAIREARKRAQDAETARIRAEETLAAERRVSQARSTPNEEQRKWAEEEALLANSETDANTRYWINANRQLRASTRASNEALTTASDIRDRTAFDRIAITNPKVHKAYETRVEAELEKLRAVGQTAPRVALLTFLLGKDMLEGKLKPRKSKSADATRTSSTVDRGRTPGARSDVSARGRSNEQEKRRERLRNQVI